MSDDEGSCPALKLADAVAEVGDWRGPVTVRDLRAVCCEASGREVHEDRPCCWVDNVLSPGECAALLRRVDRHHREPREEDLVPGVRSQFGSDDAELAALLWRRLRGVLPEALDGGAVFGLMPMISHARYAAGQAGFPHMDFRHLFRGYDGPGVVASRISFTLYLNDDYEGGELSFAGELRGDGAVGRCHSQEKPRAGSAVLFYQCVPEFAHMPHAVKAGYKNILRADVLYTFADKESADVGGLHLS